MNRFLAYSSITHVGFLLIAQFDAVLIHLITYIISSQVFFLILLSLISYNNREITYFNDLNNINSVGLFYPFALVISLVSMAVLPPFAGFYGKYLIWVDLFENLYLLNDGMSFILLTSSTVLTLLIIFYYIRVSVYLFINTDFATNRAINAVNFSSVYLSSDQIFYLNSSQTQLVVVLLVFLIFWTFVHEEVVDYVSFYFLFINTLF